MSYSCHNQLMEMTTDRYQVFSEDLVDIRGDAFKVRVHWAERDGRMVVVGLDLRAFHSDVEAPAVRAILQGDQNLWFSGGEVSVKVLRSLKFAEALDQSRGTLLEHLERAPAPAPEDASARAAIRDAVEDTKRRPGPKPVVSDDLLAQVVAPAYRAAPRKPVEAVREALEAALGEPVTRPQASKAVQRARNLRRADGTPLIPQAPRKTR
jgi:hypothetical protein